MAKPLRAFVALELNDAVRAEAADVIRQLEPTPQRVKWVEPSLLHITMKFLGELPLEDVHAVHQVMRASLADVEPLVLDFVGVGAFPRMTSPRTIWLGVREIPPGLIELHGRLEQGLAKMGFRAERRRFTPHVTIGRVRGAPDGMDDLVERLQTLRQTELGSVTIDRLVLFSSDLTPRGPIYEEIAAADFE